MFEFFSFLKNRYGQVFDGVGIVDNEGLQVGKFVTAYHITAA